MKSPLCLNKNRTFFNHWQSYLKFGCRNILKKALNWKYTISYFYRRCELYLTNIFIYILCFRIFLIYSLYVWFNNNPTTYHQYLINVHITYQLNLLPILKQYISNDFQLSYGFHNQNLTSTWRIQVKALHTSQLGKALDMKM